MKKNKKSNPKLAFRLGQAESPIWSNDKDSKTQFGHNIIDFQKLRLKPKLILQVSSLASLDRSRTNPIHPSFPSFWSGAMYHFFQQFTIHVYSELESRFQKFYELENQEKELMNSKINQSEIDEQLTEFLSDPLQYIHDQEIKLKENLENIEEEIRLAYENWKEQESGWI